jgi:cytoskeletal protein RodZ
VLEIGRSLREARERRGIALPEAEAATMIRARYLEALEAERFELVPEGPYLRSFLREYAEYLGLDGDIFVAEYMRSHPPPPPEPEAPAPHRLPLLIGDLVRRRGLLIASLLIVATIAVWQLGSSSRNAVQPATPPASATPGNGAEAAPAPTTVAAPHVTRPKTHAVLALTAVHGSCWLLARLRTSTGTVIAEQTLAQGQTARFGLLRPLWIRLGAPWNVEAWIGKKSVTGLLPALTGNVLVTAGGVQPA